MKRFAAMLIVLAIALSGAMAGPRFAVVRVDDILQGMASYQAAIGAMNEQMAKIPLDQRSVRFEETMKELDAILTRLRRDFKTLDDKTKRELSEQSEAKRNEAESLRLELESHRAKETRRLRQELIATVRPLQSRIMQTAARIAQEQGFDSLFDTSGKSNTGLEVIIFAKDPTDLTDDVIAALKDSEPAAPAPAPNPTPIPSPTTTLPP